VNVYFSALWAQQLSRRYVMVSDFSNFTLITSENQHKMKKIFITLAFILIAIFAFNNIATASTTINFMLKVTDNYNNCQTPNPYTGYYHVSIAIILNGVTLCQHDQYDIQNTSQAPNGVQVTWVCSQTLTAFDHYTVRISICRFSPPNTNTCCDGNNWGPYDMNTLTQGGDVSISTN